VFINAVVEPRHEMVFSTASFEDFLLKEDEARLICHNPSLCEMNRKTAGLQYSSMKLSEIEIKKAWKTAEKDDESNLEKVKQKMGK
jgi:hypothetical protein